MAWTNPPTFSSGAVLSATQLNILADDLEYLYGLIQGINPAINANYRFNSNFTGTNNGWAIRHRHRYLHYRARVVQGTNTLFKVVLRPYIAGGLGTAITLVNNTASQSDPFTYTGFVDLNPHSLSIGTEYHLHVENTMSPLGTFAVDYFKQSDTSTL